MTAETASPTLAAPSAPARAIAASGAGGAARTRTPMRAVAGVLAIAAESGQPQTWLRRQA